MIRVSDLDKSIEFYNKVLKLNLIRRNDFPDRNFTLVFLGYGKEEKDIIIELTYNWQVTQYDLGTGFGHLAFGVNDLHTTCEQAMHYGGKITRIPGLLKTSGGKNVAFVTDPDHYPIELIEW
jgi:lactoylglutathione lyase